MTLRSVESPVSVALRIYRGDTFDHEVTWTHGGSPVDLTGWTGLAQARARADSTSVLVTFTVVERDAEAGVFALTLTAAQTADLLPGAGVWDVQFTHSDGRKVTPCGGTVTVSGDVAR